MMAQTDSMNPAAKALDRLAINFREYPCKTGALYFCTDPATGLTFDMKYEEDGTIHLWRFIGESTVLVSGTRCEYRSPKKPNSAIGIEVTNDGEINFYARQMLDAKNPEGIMQIGRFIRRYVNLIGNSSFQTFSVTIGS